MKDFTIQKEADEYCANEGAYIKSPCWILDIGYRYKMESEVTGAE